MVFVFFTIKRTQQKKGRRSLILPLTKFYLHKKDEKGIVRIQY